MPGRAFGLFPVRGLGVLVIRPAVRSLHQDRAGRGHMSLNPISSQSLTVFIVYFRCTSVRVSFLCKTHTCLDIVAGGQTNVATGRKNSGSPFHWRLPPILLPFPASVPFGAFQLRHDNFRKASIRFPLCSHTLVCIARLPATVAHCLRAFVSRLEGSLEKKQQHVKTVSLHVLTSTQVPSPHAPFPCAACAVLRRCCRSVQTLPASPFGDASAPFCVFPSPRLRLVQRDRR